MDSRDELRTARDMLDRYRVPNCTDERSYEGKVYVEYRKWSLVERIMHLRKISYSRGYNAGVKSWSESELKAENHRLATEVDRLRDALRFMAIYATTTAKPDEPTPPEARP